MADCFLRAPMRADQRRNQSREQSGCDRDS